jgi:hypothetical protein
MIKGLRNRHRQIWMLWAILLPAGIVLAWLAIPDQQAIKLLQGPTVSPLPEIVQYGSLPDYSINLRSNRTRSEWQLEWFNKKVLQVPSAVIYQLSEKNGSFNPVNAKLLGRIEAQGGYWFPVSMDSSINKPFNLVLYDFIHNKIIDSIQLKQK